MQVCIRHTMRYSGMILQPQLHVLYALYKADLVGEERIQKDVGSSVLVEKHAISEALYGDKQTGHLLYEDVVAVKGPSNGVGQNVPVDGDPQGWLDIVTPSSTQFDHRLVLSGQLFDDNLIDARSIAVALFRLVRYGNR